ncbi:MAG: sodium:solute symporter [Conexivisphaerales archaeon]
MITTVTVAVFVVLFAIFTALGFGGSRWRKGNLSELGQWALAGRTLGPYLAWFLVGADLYTAYTFISVPSALFGVGSVYMFATPYVMATFAVAMVTMVTLWKMSRDKGYITGVDYVRDNFNSRTLAILIAITGIVAELPYIALQIVGMRSVLIVMLAPYFGGTGVAGVSETALIISFVILAAFTFWSGLRGAALTAIMKDIIILATVVVVVIAVPLSIPGGFAYAFKQAAATAPTIFHKNIAYATLPATLGPAYISLFILSALQLYFYPHSINGVLSAKNVKSVRMSTAFLPLYGVGLFLLTLFGVLVYAVPEALKMVGTNGSLVVPAVIASTMPDWFTGLAFLGIFIGGLVPAAIMAIAQANLLTRNVIKEIKPNLTKEGETRLVKWASVIFKFLALAFVFVVSPTYAISLQLFGGILIAQTLPALMIGLYHKSLNKNGLIAGWAVGILSGIYFIEVANKFGQINTSLMQSPFGLLYISSTSLILNLVIVYALTYIAKAVSRPKIVLPAQQA